MYPYKNKNWYTIIFSRDTVRIITKDKIDIMERLLYLPKELIIFILEQRLPSPLKVSLLVSNEEVWWLIDAICYSPDEEIGFLTLKELHYLSR